MTDFARMTDEELEARRADLRYLAQMMSLEGLAVPDQDREEFASIEREIEARARRIRDAASSLD